MYIRGHDVGSGGSFHPRATSQVILTQGRNFAEREDGRNLIWDAGALHATSAAGNLECSWHWLSIGLGSAS